MTKVFSYKNSITGEFFEIQFRNTYTKGFQFVSVQGNDGNIYIEQYRAVMQVNH